MTMSTPPCASLLAAILLASSLPARAAGGFEQLPANEMYLDIPCWNIAVVTVLDVATNAATGEARLQVEESLRGTIKSKHIQHAFWTTPPSEDFGLIHAARIADRMIHTEIKPNEWYERGEQMGLHHGPLTTPKPGDKLIVMFLEDQDLQNDPIKLVGIYRFSEKNKETVLSHMAPAERGGLLQLLAFLYILITPFVCEYLAVAPIIKPRRNSMRRLQRKDIPLLVLIQFIAYAFYETGISSWSNIRIDLIPIIPALAASVIVAVQSIFSPKNVER